MRIGHVVRQFAPAKGGLENFVANLSHTQAAQGCEVRVVTCNRVFQSRGERLPALEADGDIEIRRIPFFGSSRYPLAPAVLSHIRDLDIIHVHAVDFFFDFLPHTRFFHGRPLVATTHGGFFHTPAWRQLKKLWFRTVTDVSMRGYAAVAACSRSDFDRFKQLRNSRRLHLIENGVDIEKFSGASSATLGKTLVTVGRFSRNKRLDRLLEAFAILVEWDPEWRLHVCGITSDLTESMVLDDVRSRHLEKFVNVHADQSVDQLRSNLSLASFFVSASEYEGFGIALVEAMSAGLIPIVHSNAAFVEFQRHNDFVNLANFAAPNEAAAAILKAWKHAQRNQSLSLHVQRSVECFSWASVAAKYAALYERILADVAD